MTSFITCLYPEPIMAQFNPNDPSVKQALKEGVDEWLEAKFAQFGKWTLSGLAAAALAGLVYLALVGLGWHKP